MYFVHIDRVHQTNIDLAFQYINSLSENEKKIELIEKLRSRKK